MTQTEIRRSISLTVNGERKDLSPGSTISNLLQLLELHPQMVVVELNRSIIRDRGAFPATVLQDGDSVELVHFVGGG
jgi:thiamine biosynthesis protein ThiS